MGKREKEEVTLYLECIGICHVEGVLPEPQRDEQQDGAEVLATVCFTGR